MNRLPIFSNIKPEKIESVLDQVLADNRAAIKKLLLQKKFTWENLMQPLEDLGDYLHAVWRPVEHLNSVVNSRPLRKVYNACLPKLSLYATEIGHNKKLYMAIKSVAESKAYKKLDISQKKIISNNLRDFKLAGIDLKPQGKKHYAELQQRLAKLSNKFSENILDATQGWSKLIEKKSELSGIPDYAVENAKIVAVRNKKKGWLFTLEQPSYIAVITYADSRNLRKEIYTAYITRASDEGPNAKRWDNSRIMQDILKSRQELAGLLKFDNYAEHSLATKMARTPKQVLSFLNKLARYSKNKAKQEIKELQQFAKKKYNVDDLQPWDITYFSEKLKQKKYSISQEELRQYFSEDQVIAGLFRLVKRLYGITIKPFFDTDIWHKDVKVFALYNYKKEVISLLYIDLYARPNKKNGAWMNDYQYRRRLNGGKIQIPITFIVCNFNAPNGKHPVLFTHEDVQTLFHEFGHSLQHMLTKIDYAGVSGINGIPWDGIEIASQFMENWCWQKHVLDLISKHYKTGKKLPKKMFQKMIEAKNFQSGLKMLKQLELGLFDFRLHTEFDACKKDQIQNILDDVREKISVTPQVKFNRFQHGFSHIFAGGYAAGYYSYKWAELLSSDFFAKFEEQGIFNKEISRSFLHDFLELGGSVDPMKLFKKFRGRPPKIEPLLKYSGLKD